MDALSASTLNFSIILPDSVFARSTDITERNSLFITPSTVRLNVTATTVSSGDISQRSPNFAFSIMYGVGVEISTVTPSRSDSAVAEEPIIWFMISLTALMLSSSNLKSGEITSGLPSSWFSMS